MNEPRLRGRQPRRKGPYPLGEVPDRVLVEIGKTIVHRLAVGHGDITGDDFGAIFANAVEGQHRSKPLGIADVERGGCAWSVKTVRGHQDQARVRLISGRNSPDYSLGIENPHDNPAATGHGVLSIWNARVNEAMANWDELRITVFVRDMAKREFMIFEEEAQRFVPDDYDWNFNERGTLDGYEKATGEHRFVWQPSGSQFSIYRAVPGSARRFRIVPKVQIVDPATILAYIKYREDWIAIND